MLQHSHSRLEHAITMSYKNTLVNHQRTWLEKDCWRALTGVRPEGVATIEYGSRSSASSGSLPPVMSGCGGALFPKNSSLLNSSLTAALLLSPTSTWVVVVVVTCEPSPACMQQCYETLQE